MRTPRIIRKGTDPHSVKWRCGRCEKRKQASDFYLSLTKSKNGDLRSSQWCKPCFSKYSTALWKTKIVRRMYWINKYKEAKGCTYCGYCENAVALDWHHTEKKNHAREGIASMKSSSLKNLFAALRKCILLCANCHRVEHQRIGWK